MKRGAYLAALKRANYVLKNIPNSTEAERALDIMKRSFIELGYEEYAEKISSVEVIN
jgi:outer membrane protein assembly factor BamD